MSKTPARHAELTAIEPVTSLYLDPAIFTGCADDLEDDDASYAAALDHAVAMRDWDSLRRLVLVIGSQIVEPQEIDAGFPPAEILVGSIQSMRDRTRSGLHRDILEMFLRETDARSLSIDVIVTPAVFDPARSDASDDPVSSLARLLKGHGETRLGAGPWSLIHVSTLNRRLNEILQDDPLDTVVRRQAVLLQPDINPSWEKLRLEAARRGVHLDPGRFLLEDHPSRADRRQIPTENDADAQADLLAAWIDQAMAGMTAPRKRRRSSS